MKLYRLCLILLLLSLPILTNGCFDDNESTDGYYNLVVPTPANGAMAVDPGEPAALGLSTFPSELMTPTYQPYLMNRGDSLYWFDFNGNGEPDPFTFAWEERSNMLFPAIGYFATTIHVMVGSNGETPLASDTYYWRRHYIPLLPEQETWWYVELRWKILGQDEEEPGRLITTSPVWHFTTSDYTISD